MKKEDFEKTLRNPNQWFDMSEDQRMVGDFLWQKFFESTVESAKTMKEKGEPKANLSTAFTFLTNSQFHYGLAIENALKGVIIKTQPDLIQLEEVGDDIKISKIGTKISRGHQLSLLAESLNIFDLKPVPKYGDASYYEYLRKILDHLSDLVIWGARYPIPVSLKKRLKYPAGTPYIIYQHYLRDISDPFLDYLLSHR